jgi:hypothetical protein
MKLATVCLLLVLGVGIANAALTDSQLIKFSDFVAEGSTHAPKLTVSPTQKQTLINEIIKADRKISNKAYRAAFRSLRELRREFITLQYKQIKKDLKKRLRSLSKGQYKWRTLNPKEKQAVKKLLKNSPKTTKRRELPTNPVRTVKKPLHAKKAAWARLTSDQKVKATVKRILRENLTYKGRLGWKYVNGYMKSRLVYLFPNN